MAVLWQTTSNPEDLRLALKHLERSIEDELAPLADLGSYLAVAHSTVTRHPPAALSPPPGEVPLRITVALDHESEVGVVRHRNGSTQWFGAVDVPVVNVVRSLLRLEPAA